MTPERDPLSAVFGALADPTRRAIVARLAETSEDRTVGEIKAWFPISQPAISRHLKVLERAGLIARTQRATARLSALEPEPLHQVSDWLEQYRGLWAERHERLDGVLAALQAAAAEQPPHVDRHSQPERKDTT
jgi:DNA-binding transcriptional ArsR family regulator